MIDFRTKKQKERDIMHRRIAGMYIDLRSQTAANTIKVSDNKIFSRIADQVNYSVSAVRSICVGMGVVK